LLSNPSWAQSLRLSEQLVVHKGADSGTIFATADHVTGRTDIEATFEGNAQLRRSGTTISADRLTYTQVDDTVIGVGSVRLTKDGAVMQGTQLQLKMDTSEGYLRNVQYSISAFLGKGFAEQIDILGPDVLRARKATYSTCDPLKPDWQLIADEMVLDQERQQGFAQSAKLYFKDTQIFAAPYFNFALGNERQTGFLTPSFESNSRFGLGGSVPFYWNIAPNRDATLTTRLMTRRGIQLGAEVRYLEPDSAGEFRYEVNPHDLVTGSSRQFASVKTQWSLPLSFNAALDARRVSDDNYLVDYGRNLTNASETRLPADFYLSRGFGLWNFQMRALKWQNILEARRSPSYEILPQLKFSTEQELGRLNFNAVLDASRFEIEPATGKAVGWRYVVNPSISYPIQTAAYFVTPKIGLHASAYQLDRNPDGATSLRRAVPTFSIDTGLNFERDLIWRGGQFKQTLEPRVFYVKTPYRNQNQFPVFADTANTDLNFASLLAENSFVGNDRIADLNQLTTLLVSRVLETKSGIEKFRVAVGQRLYFSSQRVTLSASELPRTDTRSDLLVAASGDIAPKVSVDAGMQYSVQTSKIPRANLSVRYWPSETKVINFAYRNSKSTNLDQFDLSWRWKLNARWTTLGRLNYSLANSGGLPTLSGRADRPGLVEAILGLEYDVDCWTTRFVLQRYVAADAKPTTQLFFQLELKGLGQIGNSPFDVLKRNIPGYRSPSDRTTNPSTFFAYE
jgi:LPS-assembly protein